MCVGGMRRAAPSFPVLPARYRQDARPPPVLGRDSDSHASLPVSQFKSKELLSVLSITKKPVKVFNFGSTDFVTLDPAAALLVAKEGSYVGGGSVRRCRYIRPLTPPDPRNGLDFRPSDSGQAQTFLPYPQTSQGSGRLKYHGIYMFGNRSAATMKRAGPVPA